VGAAQAAAATRCRCRPQAGASRSQVLGPVRFFFAYDSPYVLRGRLAFKDDFDMEIPRTTRPEPGSALAAAYSVAQGWRDAVPGATSGDA
jgi:hypothetical protein